MINNSSLHNNQQYGLATTTTTTTTKLRLALLVVAAFAWSSSSSLSSFLLVRVAWAFQIPRHDNYHHHHHFWAQAHRIHKNDEKVWASTDDSVEQKKKKKKKKKNAYIPKTHAATTLGKDATRIFSNHPSLNATADDNNCKDSFVYTSGIPTLRSSVHRVKFKPKHRKMNADPPKPRDRHGRYTNTLKLPDDVCRETVFDYNPLIYQELTEIVTSLFQNCDPTIVGSFRPGSTKLEDFEIPVQTMWRAVNGGGNCEAAQTYLSEKVAQNEMFLSVFDRFVKEEVVPHFKQRLCSSSLLSSSSSTTNENDESSLLSSSSSTNENDESSLVFYYQRPPTVRLQPGPAWAQVKAHCDAEYGHQLGELNFWVPLTNRQETKVDLWCETYSEEESNGDDYYDHFHPIVALPGQIISFHGSSCRHYVNPNPTSQTRVSLDFRIGVQGYFDPFWQMKGTSNDHGRAEVVM